MKAIVLAGWGLALALVSGCATLPFPSPPPFSDDSGEPAAVPLRFEQRLAPRYEQVQAVTFRYRLRELSTLGVLAVDLPGESFALSCLTPLGATVFEMSGAGDQVEGRFLHPEFAGMGDEWVEAAAADLKRAYFGWHPPAHAEVRHRRGRLVFHARDAAGVTEYRYAGPDGRLAEKIRREGRRIAWRILYRGYERVETGWVPTAMVLENRRLGYRLVISVREVTLP